MPVFLLSKDVHIFNFATNQNSISASLVMGKGLVANGVNHNFATNQLLCQTKKKNRYDGV
jgi:hypothetical protein